MPTKKLKPEERSPKPILPNDPLRDTGLTVRGTPEVGAGWSLFAIAALDAKQCKKVFTRTSLVKLEGRFTTITTFPFRGATSSSVSGISGDGRLQPIGTARWHL